MKPITPNRQYFIASMAAVLLALLATLATSHKANAGIEPGPGYGWLTISSHRQASDAISMAQRHSARFPATTVFQTDNGYYNVTLGWTGLDDGKQALPELIGSYGLPGDSYFTAGGRFTRAVWTAGAETSSIQALVATTRLRVEQYGLAQSGGAVTQTGVVSGLNPSGDNFLSLRSGPGSRNPEITRLYTGDRLTIHGRDGNWLQVSTGNGTSGWAYGKYVTTLSAAPQPDRNADRNAGVETLSPRNGFVTGLNTSGDNFLSLRSGPGTNFRELARMTTGTGMTVTGRNGPWLQVSLSNGMQGWAHGKYVRIEEIPVITPNESASLDTGNEVPVIGPDESDESSSETGRPSATGEQQASLPDPVPVTKIEPATLASDQKRVALILGNSAYENTTVLPNPKNDADAMTAKLKNLGFEVISGLDGNKSDMELAVREFVKILPDSDVALFFYAGHAMQVDGRNHLIPVDAKLEDRTALDFETIDLGVILGFMSGGDRISIALLDACRDNPLSRRFARSLGATRSAFIGRGLAAPETAGGEILIGFATAPGEVALDGDGDNSPFTTALLKHIDAKGLDIELMLKRVRNDVYEMTAQSQEPWVNSALRREFHFNPD